MIVKIYKYSLLAAFVLLATVTTVFAQDSLAVPPIPPVKLRLNPEFKQNVASLKIKMKQLQKQMSKKSFSMNIDKNTDLAFKNFDRSFKDFGRDFNDSFKGFGESFAGSFNELSPDFSSKYKTVVSINHNNKLNTGDYKQKLASGQITEKIKTYSKSYSISANDVLQISNTFGKVVVNTWAKNEFRVDVQMKFAADDKDYVDNMINGSNIIDSKSGSVVSFKTSLARNNNNGDNHIEVNYTVYMPSGNPLEITNKFGDVILPDLSGKVIAKISFGNLLAQQLTNTQNDVQIKFTQDGTSTINLFNGGKLRIAYGRLKAGTLNNIDADFSFSVINVDKLKNAANFRVKYGDGVNIGTVDKSVKNIIINASFTSFKLDFKEADNFNFDIVTKLGDFNYDNNIKVTAKTPSDDEHGWSSTKSYKGYIGKNNSDGKITINASFTDIKFY